MKDHSATLGLTCDEQSSFPTIVDFQDRDYRNKSVARQIPHYAGMAAKIPPLTR